MKLLLELSENTRENTPALVKAIESGDTDLVYTVILKLRDKMALADFKVCIVHIRLILPHILPTYRQSYYTAHLFIP